MNTHIALAGNFNLNVLDFENNVNAENFINLLFRYGKILTINKPTRVTTNTVTPIDHIITSVIIATDFMTGILKSCISDHFVIMLAFRIGEKKMCNKSEQHTSEFFMKLQWSHLDCDYGKLSGITQKHLTTQIWLIMNFLFYIPI